jgi:hypothetical protein
MQLFPFRTCSTYVVFFELVTLSLFGGFEGALLTKTAAVGALQFLKKHLEQSIIRFLLFSLEQKEINLLPF